MASEAAKVERALLALVPDDRAAVIEHGLLSLEEVDNTDQVDVAWLAEIDRRVSDQMSPEAELVDADEHCAQIRARLTPRD